MNEFPVEMVARICHETNRAYCESISDFSQPPWELAPQWQRDSAIHGVKFHIEMPRSPADSHNSWMAQKIIDGWVHGDTKDAIKKTHPCIVPFEELPPNQQIKDYLFRGVVHSFLNYNSK